MRETVAAAILNARKETGERQRGRKKARKAIPAHLTAKETNKVMKKRARVRRRLREVTRNKRDNIDPATTRRTGGNPGIYKPTDGLTDKQIRRRVWARRYYAKVQRKKRGEVRMNE
jgi:hypothetical protein